MQNKSTSKSQPLGRVLAFSLIALGVSTAQAQERLVFSGGPDGGRFQLYAEAIATHLSGDQLQITPIISAGSIENLRRVNARDADFGIVYAADLTLGLNGGLTNDARHYRYVLAVSALYPAPAQLVVMADSAIEDPQDLIGRRVAVGPAGSGAAAFAERYFKSLGIWDQISPRFVGYSQGADALAVGQVDALWVFAGYPTPAIAQLSQSQAVRLLDTHAAAEASGFYASHPYYQAGEIPAGVYTGIEDAVYSVQDLAVWVAGAHVSDAQVSSQLLQVRDGLNLPMLDAEKALEGVTTPIHPGVQTQ